MSTRMFEEAPTATYVLVPFDSNCAVEDEAAMKTNQDNVVVSFDTVQCKIGNRLYQFSIADKKFQRVH